MESLAREILDMESNLEKEGQWILSSSCNVNSDVTCKKKALLPHHCLFHNLEMFVHQGRLPLTFLHSLKKAKERYVHRNLESRDLVSRTNIVAI